MRLSARPILNFNGVNSLSSGNQWIIRQGDPNTLYFQLFDLDQGGLRYMAGQGVGNTPVSISVIFPSIDDTKVITLTASPVTGDASMWSIAILSTATPYSGNVQFAVTEGSNTRSFFVLDMLKVELATNCGSDGKLANSPAVFGNPQGI